MLIVIQKLLILFYWVLPVAMLIWGIERCWRRGRIGPLVSVLFTLMLGVAVGTVVLVAYARLFRGGIPYTERLRLVYFAMGAICAVRLVDRVLLRLVFDLARVRADAYGRARHPNQGKALLALLAQRAVMMALVLPYALALLAVYRPKMPPGGTPAFFNVSHTDVRFAARDGVALVGWWIPAQPALPSVQPESLEEWGKRTVILCHGVASSKERQFGLAWVLSSRGFNVLVFDFRGHGGSGGNFTSFGDRERLDVLGAVEWVRSNQRAGADRIYGVGVNAGAAALLAASADEEVGRHLDALVVCEPYARLDTLARTTIQSTLPAWIAFLAERLSIPIAGLHAGADLRAFAPIDAAAELWPRPLLVVHGRGQTFVPQAEELALYRAARHPKEQFWPADRYEAMRARQGRARGEMAALSEMLLEWLGMRDGLLQDAGVQYRTIDFLREAEPVL